MGYWVVKWYLKQSEMTLLTKCYMIYWISIQALLSAPNPDDPLSENIAKHWKTNETEAVETGNINYF